MADNVIDFNKSTKDDGPKKHNYVFELKNPEGRVENYGILSFSNYFVSVIHDTETPIFMAPYDRIASISVV
jgi:hypothetical protein